MTSSFANNDRSSGYYTYQNATGHRERKGGKGGEKVVLFQPVRVGCEGKDVRVDVCVEIEEACKNVSTAPTVTGLFLPSASKRSCFTPYAKLRVTPTMAFEETGSNTME